MVLPSNIQNDQAYKEIRARIRAGGEERRPSSSPPPKAGFNEERVRYILLDITIGGVRNYYAGHEEDPNSVEAVRRWDAGVRVINAELFDRVILQNRGWTLVYKGTERAINGMDVKLTGD